MAFERVMGLEVIDEKTYQQYRKQMTPILHSFGGSFSYDFNVNQVLMPKTEGQITKSIYYRLPWLSGY